MSEENPRIFSIFRVLRQAPTIGGRIIFTYIIGLAFSLLLIFPLQYIRPKTYNTIIEHLVLSTKILPTIAVWYVIMIMGVGFYEVLEYLEPKIGARIKQYRKKVEPTEIER